MPNDSNRVDVAVFIDFENVYVSVRDKLDANPNFESIMDRCEDLGRVVIARAYADWYRYPRITSALYANGIEPMYVPTYYYDREMGRTGRAIKNSVDMNLCVEAMRTLFTNPNISKFVLATGDRDFIPLVNAIRQQGKEVIVIGIGGAASAHLAQSADEFIFYENLVGKAHAGLLPDQPKIRMAEKVREHEPEEPQTSARTPEPVRERESAEPDVYDVLVKAIYLARERGYVCSFGSLKLLMKELMGGEFKESRYKDAAGRPFAKFKDFVLEGERRGKVQVFTNGTVNEVFLPGEDPYKLSQFAGDIKEEPPPPLALPEEQPPDTRSDGRLALTNGRRRRRRPRGQRSSNAPLSDTPLLEEQVDEGAPEDVEYGVPEEVIAEDFESDEDADAVFDSLLERVEQEDAQNADLGPFDPLTQAEVIDQQAEELMQEVSPSDTFGLILPSLDDADLQEAPAPLSDLEAQPQIETTTVIGRPFDEHDWRILREVVARFERPVSFAQIHDALRDARNREAIMRTNEELRTLIKQAINNGTLERIGKGNRISYRLAPITEQTDVDTGEPADQIALIEAAAEQAQAPPEPAEQPWSEEQAWTEEQAHEQPWSEEQAWTEEQAHEQPWSEEQLAQSELPVAEENVQGESPDQQAQGDEAVSAPAEEQAQAETADQQAQAEPTANQPAAEEQVQAEPADLHVQEDQAAGEPAAEQPWAEEQPQSEVPPPDEIMAAEEQPATPPVPAFGQEQPQAADPAAQLEKPTGEATAEAPPAKRPRRRRKATSDETTAEPDQPAEPVTPRRRTRRPKAEDTGL